MRLSLSNGLVGLGNAVSNSRKEIMFACVLVTLGLTYFNALILFWMMFGQTILDAVAN